MRILFKNVFLLGIVALALYSCGTRKEIVYVQDIEKAKSYDNATTFEPTLQPDDLLSIMITAENAEVTTMFNLPEIRGNDSNHEGIKTYLIDNACYIDFPVLGKVKLSGLTRTQASNKLVAAISDYIKAPIVNLRILNYKVSVLGEVAKPNVYTIQSERISLLDALSMAGDLTIYGKRDNILVIREQEGKKTYTRIDITNADFLNSPFYYLAQNDVVFVEPNKTQIHASKIGRDIYLAFSTASLLITIIVLVTR